MKMDESNDKRDYIIMILLIIIAVMVVVFTFIPRHDCYIDYKKVDDIVLNTDFNKIHSYIDDNTTLSELRNYYKMARVYGETYDGLINSTIKTYVEKVIVCDSR